MMWDAVLIAGLASYLLRVIPLFLLGRFELSERVSEALQHAAMGAMAVMLVTAAVESAGAGGTPVPARAGADAGATLIAAGHPLGVVAGVGLGLLLGRRGRSMPVVVVTALGAYAAVTCLAAVVGARLG